jgi:hypothetical protein
MRSGHHTNGLFPAGADGMAASEIGGVARDPKPGGKYALDDARHR